MFLSPKRQEPRPEEDTGLSKSQKRLEKKSFDTFITVLLKNPAKIWNKGHLETFHKKRIKLMS